MLGKKATVEADARDNGTHIRIVVQGSKVLRAEPSSVVVVRGHDCDNISFFSSRAAAERWQREHDGEGQLMALAEAVERGATLFGRLTAGL
jgi:hypothetical protein